MVPFSWMADSVKFVQLDENHWIMKKVEWIRSPLFMHGGSTSDENGRLLDLTFRRVSQVSDWSFTNNVHEKIYLDPHKKNQYIYLKHNTTQLYFILGIADLYWIFPDCSDIHIISNRKRVLTMCTVENLWIWGVSL